MLWELLGAGVLGLALLWTVLQPLLLPGAPRAAIYVPPDPEETRRGIALSALREIEFDRATGKLSDVDYEFLKSRYTAEAVAALRAEAVDADAADVEARIAARAKAIAEGTPACPQCGPRPESDALFCSTCGRQLESADHCARCGAAIPPDGRFCEACGNAVAA